MGFLSLETHIRIVGSISISIFSVFHFVFFFFRIFHFVLRFSSRDHLYIHYKHRVNEQMRKTFKTVAKFSVFLFAKMIQNNPKEILMNWYEHTTMIIINLLIVFLLLIAVFAFICDIRIGILECFINRSVWSTRQAKRTGDIAKLTGSCGQRSIGSIRTISKPFNAKWSSIRRIKYRRSHTN